MKAAVNTLLAVCACALALALGEIALRVAGYPRFDEPRRFQLTGGLDFYRAAVVPGYPMHRIMPDSQYLNIYSSNPRGYFGENNAIVISGDDRGFRGARPSGVPETGDINIAFLGDSCTLGEGVRFEDTAAERTARSIEDRLGGGRYTVRSWNWGMLAFNTIQEYVVLAEQVLPRRPDVVVLIYFLNDPEGPYFDYDPATGNLKIAEDNMFWIESARPPQTPLYASYVARLAWKWFYNLRSPRRVIAYYHRLFSSENPHWALNRQSLIDFVRACRERGTPLVVVCLPVLYRLDGRYPFRDLHDLVRQVVSEASHGEVAFVDMLPAFEGRSPDTLWVHATDQHPNEAAHRMIAEALTERLIPIVRGELERRAAPGVSGAGHPEPRPAVVAESGTDLR